MSWKTNEKNRSQGNAKRSPLKERAPASCKGSRHAPREPTARFLVVSVAVPFGAYSVKFPHFAFRFQFDAVFMRDSAYRGHAALKPRGDTKRRHARFREVLQFLKIFWCPCNHGSGKFRKTLRHALTMATPTRWGRLCSASGLNC